MTSITVVVMTLATFLLGVLIFSNKRKKGRPLGLPPGSNGWPLVGEAFSFLKPHPLTSRGDYVEQRISRHGKLFSTNWFGETAIVSADVELNHFILNNNGTSFEQGHPQNFVELVGESATTFVTGDAHKFQRSIFLNFFTGPGLERQVDDIEQLAAVALSRWKDNSVISANEEACKFVFNFIAKKTMGMIPGEPETETLRRDFTTFVKGSFSLPLKFLPGTARWKAFQAKATISKVIKQKFDERVTQKKQRRQTVLVQDDLLGWMMDNTSYTLDKIIVLLRLALVTSYFTTSTSITTLIYFLAQCPDALKQLREEHLEIMQTKKQRGGSLKLSWEDYKNMEFTQCVIKETLRLGGGGRVRKRALKDVQFKGYTIPQGCLVIPHVPAVNLDPSIYEDPEKFKPWRWLDASSAKKFGYMPFGGGARLCPGSDLARLEMIVFIHHLILKYNWKLASSVHPLATPLAYFPNGLPIKIEALEPETVSVEK